MSDDGIESDRRDFNFTISINAVIVHIIYNTVESQHEP
jgi:hypothetical protein